MENKNGKISDFSMDNAAKLANSDAGKRLLTHLQQQNSSALQQAMAAASAGDMAAAKSAIAKLLDDPQTAALLGKLKE